MFDKKIEPIAQRVVRARISMEEAQEALALAEDAFRLVVPEGSKYETKDGDIVTHARSSERKKALVDGLRAYLTRSKLRAPIWKAVRIDAVDMKKLNGFIEAGVLDIETLVANEAMEMTPVRSSVRVSLPAVKPTTKSPTRAA